MPGTERKADRQCWECLKKRLVCDLTLPHCKKCGKRATVCPGYGAQRPLQWLPAGKVSSKGPKSRLRYGQVVVVDSEPQFDEAQFQKDWHEYMAECNANDKLDFYAKASELYKADNLAVELSDRARLRMVVSRGLKNEAKTILNIEGDPLAVLRRMMRMMELEDLPTYNLRSETCEVVQAVQYCTSLEKYPFRSSFGTLMLARS